MSDTIDRRRVLQLTATSTVVGLAGCAGNGGTSEPTVALSVTDTESTDGTVTIPNVGIDKPGWLVIHPEASGGGPKGSVTLAEKQLDAGEYTDVSLTLDTLRKGEQTVYAMLHYDDPADGEFTFPGEGDPPVTSGGSPVVKPFTVTGTGSFSPALSVTDQETDGSSLVVPEATIDKAGWLVVHPEASGGGPNGGVTLAERRLEAGSYGSVTLSVSETLSADQTLYAMLHYDDPADGEFTFPSEGDPAVPSGGSPVVKPFSVNVTGGDNSGTTASVELKDTSFTPMRLSVEPGTTVTWTNRDGFTHDVQSAQFHDNAASWDFYSGELSQGATAEHTFESEGIYEYYCTIHGKSTMCGVVLVGDVSLDKRLPCEETDDGGDSSY